jgi:cell division protein FtsL
MSAEWVTAIATTVGVGVGLAALIFAACQLFEVQKQLKVSNLTNILSLEAEINDRKETVDDISQKIVEIGTAAQADTSSLEKRLEAAVENWLNAVDRLCFCVRKNLFPEKEWKIEYRDYIISLVRENESKFGPGSRYTNIKYINDKWHLE